MAETQRIQLRRTRGWRKPEGAVVVSRPGKFGNPFDLAWVRLGTPDLTDQEARIIAVQTFRAWLTDDAYATAFRSALLDKRRAWILEHLHELAGKNLCCWCPLPAAGQVDWCHAAVLLELARGGAR